MMGLAYAILYATLASILVYIMRFMSLGDFVFGCILILFSIILIYYELFVDVYSYEKRFEHG